MYEINIFFNFGNKLAQLSNLYMISIYLDGWDMKIIKDRGL